MTTVIQLILHFFPEPKISPLEQHIINGQPQNNGDVELLTRQFMARR